MENFESLDLNIEPLGLLPGPWHNPSLLQTAEHLQVMMMSLNNSVDPLPVEYNSHVVAVLEGFRKLQEMLKEANQRLALVGSDREKSQEELRSLTDEWMQQEATYKAEIKRLELIIAKTSHEGMATVALARGGTLVDRKRARGLVARLQRMSNSHETEAYETANGAEKEYKPPARSHPAGPLCTPDAATDKDVLASDTLRGLRLRQRKQAPRLSLRQAVRDENAEARTRVKVPDQQVPASHRAAPLAEATDGNQSDSASSGSSGSSETASQGLEFRGWERAPQLVKLTEDATKADDGGQQQHNTNTPGHRLRGFSFVSGDDGLLLPPELPPVPTTSTIDRPSTSGSNSTSASAFVSASTSAFPSASAFASASPFNIIARVAAARALARHK